jgi:hypothetical protein
MQQGMGNTAQGEGVFGEQRQDMHKGQEWAPQLPEQLRQVILQGNMETENPEYRDLIQRYFDEISRARPRQPGQP